MKSDLRVQEVGHTISAPLTFKNINKAYLWYTHIFGAKENVRFADSDHRINYAELWIGDTMLFLTPREAGDHLPLLADENQKEKWLHIYVSNVDDIIDQAVETGAFLAEPPKDYPNGERCGAIIDPFGYHWVLAMHI